MITAEELRRMVMYNGESGVMTWALDGYKHKAGDLVGWVDDLGYLRVFIKGRRYRIHRLIWLYVTGEWPKNVIDHINRDRQDNRIVNLRDVTQRANTINKGILRRNTSGKTGVTYRPRSGNWFAHITVDAKQIGLGTYSNFEDASRARDNGELKYFNEMDLYESR